MGNSSKIGTSIFVSALISMILIAGAGYFVLPLIYSNINEEIETETPNIVLQSKFVDISTQAYLKDDELSYVKIDDTELSITTQGNSSLAVVFTITNEMAIMSAFSGTLFFEILLNIAGVGNKTIPLKYYRSSGGDFLYLTKQTIINYNTGIISSGTYTIEAYWRSRILVTGTNLIRTYFWSPLDSNYINYTRTLWAQELRE